MRDDFCIFILTHGRPDKVITLESLKKAGYTGKIFLVIDDEDKRAGEYFERYGDQVLQFSKEEMSSRFDEGDNFADRRTITYARNACWMLAERVGVRYFAQFDDDYTNFEHRYNAEGEYGYWPITDLDKVLSSMITFFQRAPCLTVAMAQGGDFIGGNQGRPRLRRKAMNSFICSTDRPFLFRGRMNEDVNTYTSLGRAGGLFFTVMQVKLVQMTTQSNAGGITELYKRFGTYTKSFYTVMYAPSCTQIGIMGDKHLRIHHQINWHNAVPLILSEEHRKPRE